MSPELARGHEIVRSSTGTTWVLIGVSGLLLALLLGAYANLWARQKNLQDGIREDALWAVYQIGREARTLDGLLGEALRAPALDAGTRAGLTTRYDILYSRLGVMEDAKFGAAFQDDRNVNASLEALHAGILELEPTFDALAAPGAAADLSAAKSRVAGLASQAEGLLVRTNTIVSTLRADARSEVMRLEQVTAWIVLALAVSVGLLVLTLVRRLRVSRAAGEHLRGIADELTRAYRAAEAGNRAKSEFMATMGHEIRTPLNAILGMAELLSHSPLSPDDAEGVAAIRSSGTALLEIINEILDFAKIEHGDSQAAERVPFDAVDLARQVLRIVEGRAAENGNDLRLFSDGAEGTFIGDPTRLRRVLLNLVGNAAKFTQDGRVVVTVAVVAAPGGERLRFTVADSGIGIPQASRDRLFKPFSQVDGTIGRRFGGTGLGLSICKRIVDDAGGEIGVESVPGIGSSFWFEVPTERAPAGTAEPTAPSQGAPAAATSGLPRLRILLVEDNALNRRVAIRFLRHLGQDVEVADDGSAALAAVENDRFDLILMDMQMPVLDGIEATRRIRAMSGWLAEVPIVALTANASEADRARCLEVGMNRFEPKPLSMAGLAAVIAASAPSGSGSVSPAPKVVVKQARDAFPGSSRIDEGRVAELVEIIGQEAFEELREAFFEDAVALLGDLADAMQRNDATLTDRALHSLKGSASNVGFSGIAGLAEGLRGQGLTPEARAALLRGLEEVGLSVSAAKPDGQRCAA